jgi:hypothetical protein
MEVVVFNPKHIHIIEEFYEAFVYRKVINVWRMDVSLSIRQHFMMLLEQGMTMVRVYMINNLFNIEEIIETTRFSEEINMYTELVPDAVHFVPTQTIVNLIHEISKEFYDLLSIVNDVRTPETDEIVFKFRNAAIFFNLSMFSNIGTLLY